MTWREIQAIADTLEPGLRLSWLRAVRILRARLDDPTVARILAASPAARRALVAGIVDPTLTRALETIDLGLRTATIAASRGTLRGAFGGANPYAITAARTLAAKRVTGISKTVQRVIRAEIVRAMMGEQTAATVARRLRGVVGLSPLQARRLAARRAALVREGLTGERLEGAVGRLAALWERQRAKTIARTEAIAAANGGQVAAWQGAQRAGTIGNDAIKRWVVTYDDRLCPVCLPMAGQEQPIGESFAAAGLGAILYPPLHPNCRCAVVLASSGTVTDVADLARRGRTA